MDISLHSEWPRLFYVESTVLWPIRVPLNVNLLLYRQISEKVFKIGGLWNIFVHPPWAGVPPYVHGVDVPLYL